MALRSAARLHTAAEFRRVREEGAPCFGRYMILNVLRCDASMTAQTPRIGIVTSRRVGGAVVRNRVRRRLREIVRAHFPAAGVWLVLVAKRATADATFEDLRGEWLRLGRRASIFPA